MAVAFHGASSTGDGPDAFWKLFPLTCALAGSNCSLPLPGECVNLSFEPRGDVGLFERRTSKPVSEVNVCPVRCAWFGRGACAALRKRELASLALRRLGAACT